MPRATPWGRDDQRPKPTLKGWQRRAQGNALGLIPRQRRPLGIERIDFTDADHTAAERFVIAHGPPDADAMGHEPFEVDARGDVEVSLRLAVAADQCEDPLAADLPRRGLDQSLDVVGPSPGLLGISQPALVSPTLVRFSIGQYAPRADEFAAWFGAWEKLAESDPYFHLRTEIAVGSAKREPISSKPAKAPPLATKIVTTDGGWVDLQAAARLRAANINPRTGLAAPG